MDLLIKAKRCFHFFFFFQILILAIFYLQYMLWILPLTICHVQNMSSYIRNSFWHYTLLGSVILTFSTFFTGTVFITISGFQIIAELT